MYVTGLPCGPIGQLLEYSHSLRGVLGSSPCQVMCFSSPLTFGGQVWVRARAASSKGTLSLVQACFRADSRTNLFKQGGGRIVTGLLCGRIAKWSEYSRGLREVLGSSPGQFMYFVTYDYYFQTSSPLKLLRKSKPNFIWGLVSKRGHYHMFTRMVLVTWQRLLSCPPIYVYGKNLKIFICQNLTPYNLETWHAGLGVHAL